MTTTTNTTKNYELTILADEIAPQEAIDGLTEKIKGYGKITSFEDDGVKRLAYPIQRERLHEKTRYLYYTLELEDGVPAKLSTNLNTDDNIVRYLLVRVAR